MSAKFPFESIRIFQPNYASAVSKTPELSTRRKILRDAIGIGLGTATYGLSFGALGIATGLTLLETQLLSLIMFTGGSQFALVGTLAGGGSAISAISAASLLGVRNLAYAVRNNSLLKPRGWQRIVGAQFTIDESTAMALSHEKGVDGENGGKFAFWATGTSVFVFWNIATFLGAIAVSSVGDPNTYGLDAAIGAGFIALIWPQIKNKFNSFVAVICAIVAIIAIPLVQPGIPILLAGFVAAFIAWLKAAKHE
jgi:predicted branched-subunit amino acid permease